MKEEILFDIVKKLYYNHLTPEVATNLLLDLFAVSGRSEQLVCAHPPKQTYLLDGIWHCEKCGGKWESIANK